MLFKRVDTIISDKQIPHLITEGCRRGSLFCCSPEVSFAKWSKHKGRHVVHVIKYSLYHTGARVPQVTIAPPQV